MSLLPVFFTIRKIRTSIAGISAGDEKGPVPDEIVNCGD